MSDKKEAKGILQCARCGKEGMTVGEVRKQCANLAYYREYACAEPIVSNKLPSNP